LKIVLDSDIFISHLRQGAEASLLDRLARRSLWYMSSVVAMELRAGCHTPAEARSLQKLLNPFERAQRIVYPDHRAWMRAGAILADLDPARRQRMVHDALIALSAISIGACVVTSNRRDFEEIARRVPLTFFGGVAEALAALS
jgi:predicted nucleic acid-binding protein